MYGNDYQLALNDYFSLSGRPLMIPRYSLGNWWSKNYPYEDKTIDKILNTISAISFSKSGAKPDFETIEMKILSDADKLDAIGAIGICRTIMFGVQNHRPLFDENIFPQADLSKEQYKDLSRKNNNSINHFFDKLLKLKEAMQTEIGKKEAQKRHDFMIKFLKQFFEEQNLPQWQSYLDDYLALKVYYNKKGEASGNTEASPFLL